MNKWLIGALGTTGLLAVIIGICTKASEITTISTIIGSADGPTAIYVAGKAGGNISALAIFIGVCLLAAAAILIARRKHQK